MSTKKTDLTQHILFLRSLANDDRINILKLLIKNPLPAQNIEKLFFMEQSTASYHLNMMRKAGILDCRKEGKKAIYSYKAGSLEELFEKFMREAKK
ncbi:MAG: metalloregulator ArsR/SmtB family transcription factor [Candidatus Margulisiibacteriota bacterium]